VKIGTARVIVIVSIILLAGVVAIAATFGWMWAAEARTPSLACLMYHRFVMPEQYAALRGTERIYSLPVDRFEAQLRWLRVRGYHAVTMDDAVAFALGKRDLPQPAVLITIDDGCRSVLTQAAPILEKYNMRATLFVTTDPTAYVFDPIRPDQSRLSDDELRALKPDCVEIGAHGATHRPMTDLSDGDLDAELRGARMTLERVLNRPVQYLACPGGWCDDHVILAARKAGYTGACVSDTGAVRPGADPMRLRRINVAGSVDAQRLEDLLSPYGIARIRFKKACKQIPGRILGPRLWMPIRRVLRGTATHATPMLLLVAVLIARLNSSGWSGASS